MEKQKAHGQLAHYRENHADIPTPAFKDSLVYSETFDAEAFRMLLAQPDCVKVHTYWGMKENKTICIVTFVVNSNGQDITGVMKGTESKKLSPIGIAEQSFWDALEQFIQKTGVDLVLKIELIILDRPILEFEQHNQIYRILQEIILNSVKHSRAQRIKIEVSIEEDFLLIRTVDDGIGFDETELTLNHKHGLGLLNMQSRINFLGGSIIKSDETISGTQYNIRIPLQYEHK